MVVTHNLLGMNANRMFGMTSTQQNKSTEKLSSGYKINRAADDAAGLTISEKMRSLIRGLNQGTYNIQDGISFVQVADGALAEVNNMLHRMTELAVKSANGTNTSEDRTAIQKEADQIAGEIDRVAKSTTFNTLQIFDADESTFSSPITSLVKSSATSSGYLTEAYEYNGKYYSSASIDFAQINKDNVGLLVDKSFSFVCGYGCGETFRFTFNDSGAGNTSDTSGRPFQYNVDIKGITKGTALAKAIYDCVADNPYPGGTKISGLTTAQVSHAQAIMPEGSKLVLLDTASGTSSKEAAQTKYPLSSGDLTRGSVDASELTGTYPKDYMTEYPIQCSNVRDDVILIHAVKMNAELLGIDNLDMSTGESARACLSQIKNATSKVSEIRSGFGADQNKLEHAFANNENKAENTAAAESLLRDTDMASEMVNFTKLNILAQAGQAMMAQANQSTQSALSLLQ